MNNNCRELRKIRQKLSPARSSEIIQSFLDTFGHGLLTLTDPHSRIKVFLVRLVWAIRVTDLRGDVVLLFEHVISDTSAVSVL